MGAGTVGALTSAFGGLTTAIGALTASWWAMAAAEAAALAPFAAIVGMAALLASYIGAIVVLSQPSKQYTNPVTGLPPNEYVENGHLYRRGIGAGRQPSVVDLGPYHPARQGPPVVVHHHHTPIHVHGVDHKTAAEYGKHIAGLVHDHLSKTMTQDHLYGSMRPNSLNPDHFGI